MQHMLIKFVLLFIIMMGTLESRFLRERNFTSTPVHPKMLWTHKVPMDSRIYVMLAQEVSELFNMAVTRGKHRHGPIPRFHDTDA